jgi:hypothetical protein
MWSATTASYLLESTWPLSYLLGTPPLSDTLQSTRVHDVACFTGMWSNKWKVGDSYSIEYIPHESPYLLGCDADDLPLRVLRYFLHVAAILVPRGQIHAGNSGSAYVHSAAGFALTGSWLPQPSTSESGASSLILRRANRPK